MNRKIAIPADQDDALDAHFGHCKLFMIYSTGENRVLAEESLTPPPHEPGLLPKWLAEKGVTDIIAGGMGHKAIELFNQYGVNVFTGAPRKNTRELLVSFLDGSLHFTANYCDH